jgi:hypothetical protein
VKGVVYWRPYYVAAEAVCDDFAACLLMPRPWVKRLWSGGLQDIDALPASGSLRPPCSVRWSRSGSLTPVAAAC